MGKQLTTVGTNIMRKAGIPLAALTAGMVGLGKVTADYGDRVAKASQEIGLSVEAYQELEYALGQNGVATDQFEMAIGNLNRRLGEARRGNQKYRETLEQMGFDLEELDAGAVTTEEGFMRIIDALSQMDDAQMQASLASEFFGNRVARKLMPAIRGGAEGIEELRKRAHDLGIVMDEQAARKSELFGDTMDDLGRTMGGLSRVIGSELQAPIINISKWITDIVGRISNWIQENPKLVRQIVMVSGAIAGVLGVLVTLGTTMIITGKIIGALGVIFNILTSKPILIIAAIGALWFAWDRDWLGIRTATEKAWEVIRPILDAAWEILGRAWEWAIDIAQDVWDWIINTTWAEKWETIKGWFDTAWKWTIDIGNEILKWIFDTTWAEKWETIKGWFDSAWIWTVSLAGDAWAWLEEHAPWLTDTLKTLWGFVGEAWTWTLNMAGTAWTWLEEHAPWLTDALEALREFVAETWEIVLNGVIKFSGAVYDAIKKGFETGDWSDLFGIAADLWRAGVVITIGLQLATAAGTKILMAIGALFGNAAGALGVGGWPLAIGILSVGIQLIEAQQEGSYEAFAKNVIVAALVGAIGGAFFGPGGALLGFNLAINLKLGEILEGAGEKIGEALGIPKGHWSDIEEYEEYRQSMIDEATRGMNVFQKLWYQMSGQKPEGLLDFQEWKQLREEIGETAVELGDFDALLDAIFVAEGGKKARVPYGMTGFADAGNKFSNERNQALFEQLSQGMVEGSEEYYRTAALVSAQHYWRTFTEIFPEVAGKTFDQLEPEMQQLFVLHMGRWFCPPSAHELNKNWVPNVLSALGHGDVAKEFRAGSGNLIDAWLDGIYAKSGDAEQAANYIAGIFADYLVGESPPPEGPLSVIDEGGANVMEAWVEGAEKGIKDGVPALASGLEKVKNLFGTIWDKVPEEIRGPIEQAMAWITDLIGQAEEALFKLDDLQDELERAITGGDSAGDQAEGFIAKLTAKLNEKLGELDDPLDRFAEAVANASLRLMKVVKLIGAGDWKKALLSILMETESFAKAMELIGAVLAPVVALFDLVLKPIINGILRLWNAIIDGLASISIFGWKPFKGLKDKRINLVGEGDESDTNEVGRGGRQVSEITGPTRDLLVDLLTPLANLNAIVGPIQDIRSILDARLPMLGGELALAGAGGVSVSIDRLIVEAQDTSTESIATASIAEIERAIAKRLADARRGRGGK